MVRNHLRLGAGYRLSPAGELHGALVHAPTASASTPSAVVVSHRPLNPQALYSHRF